MMIQCPVTVQICPEYFENVCNISEQVSNVQQKELF